MYDRALLSTLAFAKDSNVVVDIKINNYEVTIALSFDNKHHYGSSKRPLLQLIFMATSSRLSVRNCRYSCYCYIEFLNCRIPQNPLESTK